jgi:very-short-patch-repair endonuclease
LVQAGFPPPETQIEVRDEYGRVFARLDMGWRAYRVGVDFDGAQHWTDSRQRNWDVERYARLPELGWIDIRVTAGLLHNRPHVLFDRLGAALIARGCPKTW